MAPYGDVVNAHLGRRIGPRSGPRNHLCRERCPGRDSGEVNAWLGELLGVVTPRRGRGEVRGARRHRRCGPCRGGAECSSTVTVTVGASAQPSTPSAARSGPTARAVADRAARPVGWSGGRRNAAARRSGLRRYIAHLTCHEPCGRIALEDGAEGGTGRRSTQSWDQPSGRAPSGTARRLDAYPAALHSCWEHLRRGCLTYEMGCRYIAASTQSGVVPSRCLQVAQGLRAWRRAHRSADVIEQG